MAFPIAVELSVALSPFTPKSSTFRFGWLQSVTLPVVEFGLHFSVYAGACARNAFVTEFDGNANVPVTDKLVKDPVLAVVDPIGPGEANVVPLSVAALIAVLHPKLPPVHVTAFVEALHVTSPVELKVPLTRRL